MYTIITLIILGIICLIGYYLFRNLEQKAPRKIQLRQPYKPIVMIVIDSLMDSTVEQTIQMKKAPALAFLKEHGTYYAEVVSCFPTMSVCIDTTLLTGTLPQQHQIYGLCYYDSSQKEWINIGTGAKESVAVGFREVLTNSLIRLNQQLISRSVSTIHESTPMPTGSIGAFIYRGLNKYQLKVPRLFRWLNILPPKIETVGPEVFSFGSMHQIGTNSKGGQPWYRYGENDRFSTNELLALLYQNRLPVFTLVYFPTNDDYIHQKGTWVTKGLHKADLQLQRLLNAFPSWEEAVEQITWVILGDSGQTDTLPDHKEAFVDMEILLSKYRLMPTKSKKPRANDQLVLSVNERMSYIHILDPKIDPASLARELQTHPFFDLIAWWEKETCQVVSGERPGVFSFSKNGPFYDRYDQNWQLQGNHEILDLELKGEEIIYHRYPDVLQRLWGVYEPGVAKLVLTVKPGYEMIFQSSPRHRGASHGSLHAQDSLVPMIITGEHHPPKHLRILDLKEWILDLIKFQQKKV
ncbi:Type I phosphodiesterase / nucleotide pyrophosphatase [Seinonella peptonophila]|uniref:Type I phosphodiesterase / nucleotide pyrophosphatase n=1 Tax=Seinonella peptonophila TaxID=112248 RepID=A0A1M4U413_9BACL|nr:alkaline phosphatase family protein [Seinonella peptonophila]SHE51479.1 Type I phosphodiesterase / nucleotide pyrophosphatase [Seinonella peptonophila]